MSFSEVHVVLEADADVAAHDDAGRGHRPCGSADAGDRPGRARGDLADKERKVVDGRGRAAGNAEHEVELHRRAGDLALLRHVENGVEMPDLEALVFGLDMVLDHALAERAHRGHRVFKDLVAEIAGAAVERRHLGEQLGGLQTLFGRHAGRAAGRRDHDDVGKLFADRVHDDAEALAVLRGRSVVLADVHVNDRRARFIRELRFADHFLDGVGNGGIVRLGDFGAADGGGDDQLFHRVPPLFVLTAIDALAVLRRDAGAVRAADHDRLGQHFGRARADVGTRLDDLARFEFHAAGGVADAVDLAVRFDVVARIDRREKLDHVVRAEQTFVAVALDEKLGRNVAEQMHHVRAVNQVSAVVCILRAHAESDQGCDFFHV